MTRWRPSHRRTLELNNATDRFYASTADKEPQAQTILRPQRQRRRDNGSGVDIDAVHRKQPIPLEKEVLRAVGELLSAHPGVLFALRMNSGAASYEASTGKYAPIWFHIWVRSPEKCRMSDFLGATVDSRLLALECKRPGWTKPTDDRERQQAAFLALVRQIGGIGAFVTSADDVQRLLP